MLLPLVVLFLVLPIAELYVLVQVAQEVGVLTSLALLVVVSFVGAWLVKREGLGLLLRIRSELAAGRLPTNQLVDGFLVLFAGALLLTPGFLTDGVGLLLLLPPTRAMVRLALLRRFRSRLDLYVGGTGPGFFSAGGWSPGGTWSATVDTVEVVDVVDRRDEPGPGAGELGPG